MLNLDSGKSVNVMKSGTEWNGKAIDVQGGLKNSKLLCFVYVFTKYRPIFTIFSPEDCEKFATWWHAHITPVMSLHCLVKHKYPKTSNIYRWT